MLSLKNLLTRKTVKNFIEKNIPEKIIKEALQIAHRAPTAVNSRPATVYDITSKKNEKWCSSQQAIKTANRIFLFCYSIDEGIANVRKFLANRMNVDQNDPKIQEYIDRLIAADPTGFMKQQLYITVGYFTTVLELQGIQGCYIAVFDKEECKKDLKLTKNVFPEILFACGYADKKDPGGYKTDFVRSFEEFYLGAV